MMQIAIIGCGWLGQPLALALQQKGHSLLVTCRSSARQQALQALGLDCHQLTLGNEIEQDLQDKLAAADAIIVCIPPGRKNFDAKRYVAAHQQLYDKLLVRPSTHLLFISTTAVYGDSYGKVTEHTELSPNTASGFAHQTIEQYLHSHFPKQTSVLRLAGLVGPDRHPAKHLAGRIDIPEGEQAVNLVHQADVISAIDAIIAGAHWGQLFHLSAFEHPSRHDYYSWACQKLGLNPPSFLIEDNKQCASGKIVDATWTIKQLGLSLRYASPYHMV
ncbi:MAG: NAD-dependent epimerase/dehydratase family protein [Paraglaciecola sp.]|nr:NAD-dependent epimerase/dehydratase family protein [Paraglaciecola sp.]NCT47661.1 NAD-dependent epimerase/dehydratase family protein [Paraglaciecola sp.]